MQNHRRIDESRKRYGSGSVARIPIQRRWGVIPGMLVVALLAVTVSGCSTSGADDLLGTWRSSVGQTWVISEGSIAITDGAVDGFTYTATDSTIELTDEPGPIACPPDQPGTYKWEIDGNFLTLTVESDACEGRMSFLDGFVLERSP